ncbi:MAG: hypothetical protein A2X86_10935 [Bdellovibrionales bacterium GWA2_49_15]|nr:MAG: hypothetical protein A2X86_10935 [Bdellovibrionales bacterium GWA2_49_15]HAZ11491.1 hypothetical protein [Bdellovibrionales bacterium]
MRITHWFLALSLFCFVPFAMARDNYSSMDEFHSVVVDFPKGGHALNTSDMQKLKSVIKTTKAKGSITKVEVAAWSDMEHPMTADLPESSRELAEMRLKSVKKVLHSELGKMKYISEFNMAERANWLSRVFNTSNAELDAVFAKKEKGALERQDFLIIRREGAPSKAVIVLKVHKK